MHRIIVYVAFNDENIEDIRLEVRAEDKQVFAGSVDTGTDTRLKPESQLIVQMLGSGFTVYVRNKGLPSVLGQGEFSRSEEHTTEPHPLMSISSAVFCLNNKGRENACHTFTYNTLICHI